MAKLQNYIESSIMASKSSQLMVNTQAYIKIVFESTSRILHTWQFIYQQILVIKSNVSPILSMLQDGHWCSTPSFNKVEKLKLLNFIQGKDHDHFKNLERETTILQSVHKSVQDRHPETQMTLSLVLMFSSILNLWHGNSERLFRLLRLGWMYFYYVRQPRHYKKKRQLIKSDVFGCQVDNMDV